MGEHDDAWVSPAEAAERLGISRDAIKKRIRRGTIDAKKDEQGRWRVRIPADGPIAAGEGDPSPATAGPPQGAPAAPQAGGDGAIDPRDVYIAHLEREIAFLREQLAQAQRTAQANALLAAVERVAALPSGTEDPVQPAPPPPRLPWWKRLLSRK